MKDGLFRGMGWFAVCAALASCGGGGGSASPAAKSSSTITFTPSSTQVVQTQGFEETFQVRATISPEPTGTQFYAVIVADKPVIQTGRVSLTANADNSATVSLRTEPALAAGTYEGQLTLHICRDAQCKDEVSLAGNVLPYSLKVLPRAEIGATGVVASSYLGAPNSYLVDPGATVVLTSNIPVTWSKGSSISGADLVGISSTPTRWEGQIVGGSGQFIGVLASSIDKPMNNSQQVIFDIR